MNNEEDSEGLQWLKIRGYIKTRTNQMNNNVGNSMKVGNSWKFMAFKIQNLFM